ncbi:MAG: hypothetical protein KJ977_00590, partial [Candidatus Omnitrophica bacterium]|nr:hypothetical protein [Candidatus Omnitrophota bacterium]
LESIRINDTIKFIRRQKYTPQLGTKGQPASSPGKREEDVQISIKKIELPASAARVRYPVWVNTITGETRIEKKPQGENWVFYTNLLQITHSRLGKGYPRGSSSPSRDGTADNGRASHDFSEPGSAKKASSPRSVLVGGGAVGHKRLKPGKTKRPMRKRTHKRSNPGFIGVGSSDRKLTQSIFSKKEITLLIKLERAMTKCPDMKFPIKSVPTFITLARNMANFRNLFIDKWLFINALDLLSREFHRYLRLRRVNSDVRMAVVRFDEEVKKVKKSLNSLEALGPKTRFLSSSTIVGGRRFSTTEGEVASSSGQDTQTNVVFFDYGRVLGTQIEDFFDETVRKLVNYSGLKEDALRRKGQWEDFKAGLRQLVIPPGEVEANSGIISRHDLHRHSEKFHPWVKHINNYLRKYNVKKLVSVAGFEDAYFGPMRPNPYIQQRLNALLKIQSALQIKFGVISNFEAAGRKWMTQLFNHYYPGLIDPKLIIITGENRVVKPDGKRIFEIALETYRRHYDKPRNPVFIDNQVDRYVSYGKAAGINSFVHYGFNDPKAAFRDGQFSKARLIGAQKDSPGFIEALIEKLPKRPDSSPASLFDALYFKLPLSKHSYVKISNKRGKVVRFVVEGVDILFPEGISLIWPSVDKEASFMWRLFDWDRAKRKVTYKTELDARHFFGGDDTNGTIQLKVTYRLVSTTNGVKLKISLVGLNISNKNCPMYLGFHPWFITAARSQDHIVVSMKSQVPPSRVVKSGQGFGAWMTIEVESKPVRPKSRWDSIDIKPQAGDSLNKGRNLRNRRFNLESELRVATQKKHLSRLLYFLQRPGRPGIRAIPREVVTRAQAAVLGIFLDELEQEIVNKNTKGVIRILVFLRDASQIKSLAVRDLILSPPAEGRTGYHEVRRLVTLMPEVLTFLNQSTVSPRLLSNLSQWPIIENIILSWQKKNTLEYSGGSRVRLRYQLKYGASSPGRGADSSEPGSDKSASSPQESVLFKMLVEPQRRIEGLQDAGGNILVFHNLSVKNSHFRQAEREYYLYTKGALFVYPRTAAIFVGVPSEARVKKLLTANIANCVGVTFSASLSNGRKVFFLSHLFNKEDGPKRNKISAIESDWCEETLSAVLEVFEQLGANKDRIAAYVAGGHSVCGQAYARKVASFLRSKGLSVDSRCTGGMICGRKLSIDVASGGKVWISPDYDFAPGNRLSMSDDRRKGASSPGANSSEPGSEEKVNWSSQIISYYRHGWRGIENRRSLKTTEGELVGVQTEQQAQSRQNPRKIHPGRFIGISSQQDISIEMPRGKKLKGALIFASAIPVDDNESNFIQVVDLR